MDAPALLTPGAVGSPAWLAAGGLRSLPPGYFEWRPPAALRPAVTCLWARVSADGGDRDSLVLPDACTDLIWEPGRGAFVAGPDTGPVPTTMAAALQMPSSRLRPLLSGAGGSFMVGFLQE